MVACSHRPSWSSSSTLRGLLQKAKRKWYSIAIVGVRLLPRHFGVSSSWSSSSTLEVSREALGRERCPEAIVELIFILDTRGFSSVEKPRVMSPRQSKEQLATLRERVVRSPLLRQTEESSSRGISLLFHIMSGRHRVAPKR